MRAKTVKLYFFIIDARFGDNRFKYAFCRSI